MLDDLVKEERERRARLLIEGGGPPPKVRRAKGNSDAAGKYTQLVELVFGDMNPTAVPELQPQLPEGVHPDSVFRQRSGAAWKAQITCVDVSLSGDGCHRHLSVKEVGRVYSAMAFANRKGMVFNVLITISWGMLGIGKVDHGEVAVALKEFCKGLLNWGRYSGLSPEKHDIAYVYAHEASQKLGLHTHMLVSVPRELSKKLEAWAPKGVRGVSKVGGVPPGTVDVRNPNRRKPYLEEQWRWFSYLCKGIDPYANVKVKSKVYIPASMLIHHHLRSPGEVRCRKMVGCSSNIAEGAQKSAGFQSSWQRGLFDVRLLYSGEEYRQWLEEQQELLSVKTRPGDYIQSLEVFS